MQPSVFLSSGMARLQAKNVPLRLTSTTRSQSASVVSSVGPSTHRPAVLTSTSMRPVASTASPIRFSMSATLLTSQVTPWTSVRAASRPHRSSSATALRSPSTSVAPASANRRAVAAPTPPAAPVITTVLPLMSDVIRLPLGGCRRPRRKLNGRSLCGKHTARRSGWPRPDGALSRPSR